MKEMIITMHKLQILITKYRQQCVWTYVVEESVYQYSQYLDYPKKGGCFLEQVLWFVSTFSTLITHHLSVSTLSTLITHQIWAAVCWDRCCGMSDQTGFLASLS